MLMHDPLDLDAFGPCVHWELWVCVGAFITAGILFIVSIIIDNRNRRD